MRLLMMAAGVLCASALCLAGFDGAAHAAAAKPQKKRPNTNQSRNQKASQAARQQQQRRLQQQRAQAAARARARNNARRNVNSRPNPNNRFAPNYRAPQIARVNPNFRPNLPGARYNPLAMRFPGMPYPPNANNFQNNAGAPAAVKPAIPVLVSKDFRLQTADKLDVRSLVSTEKKATFQDLAIGQSITVTLVNENAGQNGGPGELTGKVVKLDMAESGPSGLTLRTQSYQVGAQPGEVIAVEPTAGQYVTSILIRAQAPGAAALFKQ